MIVPAVCEECFDKRIKEIVNLPWPKQDSSMPVKKYFELFKNCCIVAGIPLDTGIARDLFVHGLTTENEEEYVKAPIPPSRPVDNNYLTDLVCYLSSIEAFKRSIFEAKEYKHN